jgi:hypothetical protein
MGRRKCALVTRGLLMGCASWVLLLIKFKITVLFFFEIKKPFFLVGVIPGFWQPDPVSYIKNI